MKNRNTEEFQSDTKELKILITEEDKYGNEISKMSNFFDGYIKQLSYDLGRTAVTDVLNAIPIADFGIIGEVVHSAVALMSSEFTYLPDFDHLPSDVREKLDKGIYRIGQSKQVDGNFRAVILDENGVRVKDITLKLVRSDPLTLEMTRSLTNQLQMRQINLKLDTIQALQEYQIESDRYTNIINPFFTARTFIRKAEEQSQPEKREEYLSKAADELSKTISNVYGDIQNCTKLVLKKTKFPIIPIRYFVDKMMGYIAQDIQLATTYTGLLAHVYEYLGDSASAQIVITQYQIEMGRFFDKSVTRDGLSAADVVHNNYHYIKSNLDFWYKLKKEIKPMLLTNQDTERKILLVSVEDDYNG